MKDYFLIRAASDPKIVGSKEGFAQAEIVKEEFTNKSYYESYMNYFEPKNSELHWKNRTMLPKFNLVLEHLKMVDRSIPTDFLTFSPNLFNGGLFLLSERALALMKKFNLGIYTVFEAFVYYKEERLNYYFFCCPSLSFRFIDFSKTIFFEGSVLLGKKLFQVSSGREFERNKEEILFGVEKLAFTSDFDLDYFSTIVSIPRIFISKGLKDAIEAESLTGLNIVQITEPCELVFNL